MVTKKKECKHHAQINANENFLKGSKYNFKEQDIKPWTTLNSLPGITSTAPANTDRTFLSGRSNKKKIIKVAKYIHKKLKENKK